MSYTLQSALCQSNWGRWYFVYIGTIMFGKKFNASCEKICSWHTT